MPFYDNLHLYYYLIAHAHSARPSVKVDCFWWIVFGLAAYLSCTYGGTTTTTLVLLLLLLTTLVLLLYRPLLRHRW